jgi:hypothetical protein
VEVEASDAPVPIIRLLTLGGNHNFFTKTTFGDLFNKAIKALRYHVINISDYFVNISVKSVATTRQNTSWRLDFTTVASESHYHYLIYVWAHF